MDKSDICFDNICRLKRNSYKKFLTKRYNRKLNKTIYNFHNDEINHFINSLIFSGKLHINEGYKIQKYINFYFDYAIEINNFYFGIVVFDDIFNDYDYLINNYNSIRKSMFEDGKFLAGIITADLTLKRTGVINNKVEYSLIYEYEIKEHIINIFGNFFKDFFKNKVSSIYDISRLA